MPHAEGSIAQVFMRSWPKALEQIQAKQEEHLKRIGKMKRKKGLAK
jgi:uncharacterized protein YciI